MNDEPIGERGNRLAADGWRYTARGEVRHFTRPTTLAEPAFRFSSCGLSAWAHYWRGTGSQEEYEALAAMPPCLRCVKVERFSGPNGGRR